jgi:cellobiose-specific phosphotransferase system component IIB
VGFIQSNRVSGAMLRSNEEETSIKKSPLLNSEFRERVSRTDLCVLRPLIKKMDQNASNAKKLSQKLIQFVATTTFLVFMTHEITRALSRSYYDREPKIRYKKNNAMSTLNEASKKMEELRRINYGANDEKTTLKVILADEKLGRHLIEEARKADLRMTAMNDSGDDEDEDVERKNELTANMVKIFGEEEHPISHDKCWPNEHSGYDGFALTWGMTFRTASAAECCAACREHSDICSRESSNRSTQFFNTSFGIVGHCGEAPFKEDEKMVCNIWVYCPPNEKRDGKCWSQDIHDHLEHECWLKYQKDSTKPISPSSGRYPNKHLQEHKTSPEIVQWISGAIVKEGQTSIAQPPHFGGAANQA